jgi:hypothetical protein
MLWLSALLLMIPVLQALPDTIGLLDKGSLGRAFGTLLLLVLIILTAAAVACVGLGYLLLRADRVGRILTVALAGSLIFSLLQANSKGTAEVVVILCSFAAIALLTLSPNARAYLTGPTSRTRGQPPPVAAARALVIYIAWALGAIGLALLPVGPYAAKFYVVGIGLVGISAMFLLLARRLAMADTWARTVTSALLGGYIVLLLVASGGAGNLWLPLGLVVAALTLLWIPNASREFFAMRRISG